MAYPAYVREKVRELRVEKHLSIDELANRLAPPKTTIYYWVKDLPLGRPRSTAGERKGTRNMRNRHALRRAAAYLCGRIEFEELIQEPTFRDFVCMYMAEGYKRSRYGVLNVRASDTLFRARLQGWMDCLQEQWLDSMSFGA